MPLWSDIEQHIGAATNKAFKNSSQQSVGGGCINSTYRIASDGQQYFVKLNSAEKIEMFEAEAEGLEEISHTNTVRAPVPVCFGTCGTNAYLVMEYLDLSGGGAGGAETLGRQLAQMHRVTSPQFGWNRDNTIGSTPQVNRWNPDWVTFVRENRIGYQLKLAASKGYGGNLQRQGERLMAKLEVFFAGYHPLPSLLHGDLWSGNYAITADGNPAIYDPAVYYGDREADLAMTELFGGFPNRFYAAYREHFPLDVGYPVRKILYNLYHILNHLNLFGGGYHSQAQHMIESLLSEIH